MTLHSPLDRHIQMDRLAKAASALGYEIVDVVGFFDLVDEHAKNQRAALGSLGRGAGDMAGASRDISALVETLTETSDQALRDVGSSVALVRQVSAASQGVAGWVKSVAERSGDVGDTLRAVKTNNTQIASIATQVNTLAINAKIEAARAGDAGRGFAVVADAINELSHKTATAAKQITQNVETLSEWISDLQSDAARVAEDAEEVLTRSTETDQALGRMQQSIQTEHQQTVQIADCSTRMRASMKQFKPAVTEIDTTVRETSSDIEKAHARMTKLVDASEQIVQLVSAMGGDTEDAVFITQVRASAKAISEGFDLAIADGRITLAQLFDQSYRPVPGSDPEQYTTAATAFCDAFLPTFQEPVLGFDPKVVFCAAVDTQGYLPTHNLKFSQPQGADPVWNAAHCRNRRIFADRVGLKAGRSTAPFLLQVYRRDMGGGTFRMMKDLSAPLYAGGRHWGGLRLAYSYD